MRLDDYQKWLDSMFVDEPAAPQPQLVEEIPQVEVVAESTVAALSAPSLAEPVPNAPVSRESAAAIASPPVSPARQAARPDEEDVPQIDDYLPFRRARQTPESFMPTPEPEQVAPTVEVVELDREIPKAAAPDADQAVEPIEAACANEALALESLETEPPVVSIPVPAPQSAPVRKIVSPGRARQVRSPGRLEAGEAMKPDELWSLVPRHLKTLFAMQNDEVAQNSYKREFKESRVDLVSRLLDPTLSLEETARLLNVCPTTVRRYTNKGLLTHHRTHGDQRRFRLSDVLAFLDASKD